MTSSWANVAAAPSYLIARQDASFGLTPLSTSATSFTQVPPKEAAPSGNGYSFLLAGKQKFIGALEIAPVTLQAKAIQMDWAIVTIGGRQYLQPTDNDQVVVGIHLHDGAPDVSRLYLVGKPGICAVCITHLLGDGRDALATRRSPLVAWLRCDGSARATAPRAAS